MKPLRPVADVGKLPTVRFGTQSLGWWATLGFIVSEGTTLVICGAVYLYLRQNFHGWPPRPIMRPDLAVPSLGLLLMLISIVPAYLTARAAKAWDRTRARNWMLVKLLFTAAIITVRGFEFKALGVRWDTTAYGSAVWAILGFHATLLVVDFGESLGIAASLFQRQLPPRILADVSDDCFYWYFIVAAWIPLYVLAFWGPRFL